MELVEIYPADVVSAAMEQIVDCDVPEELSASVQRQSQCLLALASSLVNAGLDAQQVRSVIEQACLSYLDELVSTILVLRARDERIENPP